MKRISDEEQQGHKPTLRQMTPEETAYLAGIFDGEGHLRVELHRQRNRTMSPVLMYGMLTIANTSRPLIDWLLSIGGRVQTYPRAPHKTIYAWNVYRQGDIVYLVRAMLPYLVVKRDIALKTLDELAKPRVWNRSNWRPPVVSGEANKNSKLTQTQVDLILMSPRSGADLAREFGVYRSTVNRIRQGKGWSHVSKAPSAQEPTREFVPAQSSTELQPEPRRDQMD
jgi:hypothetical protein